MKELGRGWTLAIVALVCFGFGIMFGFLITDDQDSGQITVTTNAQGERCEVYRDGSGDISGAQCFPG